MGCLMKAVVCERWGEPAEVLQVRDVPDPTPGPGQVLVRMLVSPINPSDLFMVRGVYGKQPSLPCIPGFEGVGIVEKGRAPLSWVFGGKRVAVLNGASATGNWAEKVVIPALRAIPIPDSMSDEQAASFFVNPASALAMVRYVLRVPRGAWLLQTAAGSALGRIGHPPGHAGRLQDDQRRPPLGAGRRAEGHRRDGGDCHGSRVDDGTGEGDHQGRRGQVRHRRGVRSDRQRGSHVPGEAWPPAGLQLALDAAADAGPAHAAGRREEVAGFWLSEWINDQGVLTKLFLFSKLRKMIGQGVLDTNPGTTFPLEQVAEAVKLADQPGRKGKVLLRIGTR